MQPTLKELREDWQEKIEHEGGHCPLCERWGKINPRPFNRTMANSLVWLYKATDKSVVRGSWVDVPNIAPKEILRTGQHSTLPWWGLLERKPKLVGDDGQHSGLWRITAKGREFVEGKITVPQKVFSYNNKVVGFSENHVTIVECFGTEFDYKAVMAEQFKTRT